MTGQQAEKNIALLRDLYEEVFEKGDISGYKRFFDENIHGNYPPSWSIVYGSSNTEEIDAAWKAFKFKNVLTKDVFANDPKGEKIVVRWSCEGTHERDFRGVKAENKPFFLTGMTIYRFSPEGKIAEVWQAWDMFGLLYQIGGLHMNK